MKIGILTFHWATNYGAVVQSYALQTALEGWNHDVEVIDYYPMRVVLRNIVIRIARGRIADFLKEARLRRFRARYLHTSQARFCSAAALQRARADYDVYVCGSDQIWNESFIQRAEKSAALSYYLDFVQDDRKRLAYAASFGTSELAPDTIRMVRPVLAKFARIGVREKTGFSIVRAMGLDATLVADPTLLLRACDYEKLIGMPRSESTRFVVSYILHDNHGGATAVLRAVMSQFAGLQHASLERTVPSLERWLQGLRDATFVVTNSFHGVVFCLTFNTPFVVVPVATAKSNDRIYTLLEAVGLADRLVSDASASDAVECVKRPIDWISVDALVDQLRTRSQEFLKQALV